MRGSGRLRRKETIQEDEVRLRLTMEVAGLGTYDWDLPTGVIRWWEKVREVLGLLADVPLSQEARAALIHLNDPKRALALFAAAAEPDSCVPGRVPCSARRREFATLGQ